MELNKIIQGDCIDVLKQTLSESVDIVFADPPFNLGKKYKNYNDHNSNYIDWSKIWLKELARITKPTGSIFVHNIPKWLTYYGEVLNNEAAFKHWISWDAPTSPMGKSLQPAHYGILYYTKHYKDYKFYEIRHHHKRCRKCSILQKDYGGKKSQIHPFGPLVSDVWTDIFRAKHKKYRDLHPCQLPIHLLERIILMSSDEGDIIFDPFSGTGTSAIAAKRLGRNFMGCELSEEYIDIANKRIEAEQTLSKLGDCYVSLFLNDVVTLRDQDWDKISEYFAQGQNIERERIQLIGKNFSRKNKISEIKTQKLFP